MKMFTGFRRRRGSSSVVRLRLRVASPARIASEVMVRRRSASAGAPVRHQNLRTNKVVVQNSRACAITLMAANPGQKIREYGGGSVCLLTERQYAGEETNEGAMSFERVRLTAAFFREPPAQVLRRPGMEQYGVMPVAGLWRASGRLENA